MRCVDNKFIAPGLEDTYNFRDFENFKTKSDYALLSIGPDYKVFDHYDDIVWFDTETPNSLVIPSHEEVIYKNFHKIKKIITPCKYTAEYYNNETNTDRWITGFLPFDIKYTPTNFTKQYDVYFTGHLYMQLVSEYINVVNKFNNCIVSYNIPRNPPVDYQTRLNLNAKSKISVVHNCLDLRDRHLPEKYKSHGALALSSICPLVPQIKYRTLEAAIGKSLILAYYDPYKIIEDYLTVNEDFIYWYDLIDLEEKINYILKNFDSYSKMIQNAHNKILKNCNTTLFFEKYLRNL